MPSFPGFLNPFMPFNPFMEGTSFMNNYNMNFRSGVGDDVL
jgi:hypothetical protein